MRSAICLIVGIAIGVVVQTAVAQQREVISLNHVEIAVPDFDAASRFYSEGVGFPQSFAFREANGSPTLAYFQINRNTFIELMPVTPEWPAGFVHFGLEVTQLDALVKRTARRPNGSARPRREFSNGVAYRSRSDASGERP